MERTETMTAVSAPSIETGGAYIDWAAVLGAAVVAAATAGLFTAFGAALGLSTISAKPGEGSFSLWLIVTALWLVITLVASYLAGGYIVGRMRRRLDDASSDWVAARDGINGLVVWALGMLVTAWMAAGAFIAAETARKSAILTAFLLTAAALVAGAVAVLGAVLGGRHRDEGRIWGGFSYRL